MWKIFTTMALLITFSACSQQKNKESTMIISGQDISAQNITDRLSRDVKFYSKEPVYKLSYENYYCYFELFVNDILVFKDFENPLAGSAVEINHAVFKSGEQKIHYKMYPVGKVKATGEVYDSFPDIAYLKFKLKSYDKKDLTANDIVYTEYRTPGTILEKTEYHEDIKFEGAGRTYYEGSFTINVDVPYELHPAFEDAQDLRKMDAKTVESLLLQEYHKLRESYQRKDLDQIARAAYGTYQTQMVTEYAERDLVRKAWEEIVDIVKTPSFEVQPLAQYKLCFFADGRLATLMLDTNDSKFRGNNALWAKVNYKGALRPFFITRYFYMPKGQNELQVY